MPHEIKTGAVLVHEGALLPDGLEFESEPCVPGWRLIKNLNPFALDRKIREAGWTFICLAGEIKATVFGIDDQSMVRRAIERIVTKRKPEEFNSLEITGLASVVSARFPLVHYVTVSAQSRHVQESLFLNRAVDLPEMKTRNALLETPGSSIGTTNGIAPISQERVRQISATHS
jgi:hypothetical protein